MNLIATATLAAAGKSALATVAFVVVGVVLVGGLIWAFRLGARIRSREPAPPRPEEQPRLPADGPVRESYERREPDEMPRSTDGTRLTPHELHPNGGRDARTPGDGEGEGGGNAPRPRWDTH